MTKKQNAKIKESAIIPELNSALIELIHEIEKFRERFLIHRGTNEDKEALTLKISNTADNAINIRKVIDTIHAISYLVRDITLWRFRKP